MTAMEFLRKTIREEEQKQRELVQAALLLTDEEYEEWLSLITGLPEVTKQEAN